MSDHVRNHTKHCIIDEQKNSREFRDSKILLENTEPTGPTRTGTDNTDQIAGPRTGPISFGQTPNHQSDQVKFGP